MSRGINPTGLSTCLFTVGFVFGKSVKRNTVRAIGALLALGCAVVFDGRIPASAQDNYGLLTNSSRCWRVEAVHYSQVFRTYVGRVALEEYDTFGVEPATYDAAGNPT